MLYAYNTAPQVLAQGAPLAFANAGARRGCCERLEGGSVRLCRPGTYRVSVTASASVQAVPGAVSPVPATLAVQATQAQEVSACSVTVERVA